MSHNQFGCKFSVRLHQNWVKRADFLLQECGSVGVSRPGDCLWVKKTSLELHVSSVLPPVSQEKCCRSGKGRGENLPDRPQQHLAGCPNLLSDRLLLLVVNLRSLTHVEDLQFPHGSGGWFPRTGVASELQSRGKCSTLIYAFLKIKLEFTFFTLKFLFFSSFLW